MSDEQEITGYIGVALVIHTKISILVINLNPKVIINQKIIPFSFANIVTHIIIIHVIHNLSI